MSKIQARDCLFKLVYEYVFLKDTSTPSLNNYLNQENLDDADKKFITDSYFGIAKNYDEILSTIEHYLEKYTINKVYKIDLSILIMAIYEICIMKNPNIKLEINEAVELAKKYSNDNSFKFINGVLARIVNG